MDFGVAFGVAGATAFFATGFSSSELELEDSCFLAAATFLTGDFATGFSTTFGATTFFLGASSSLSELELAELDFGFFFVSFLVRSCLTGVDFTFGGMEKNVKKLIKKKKK